MSASRYNAKSSLAASRDKPYGKSRAVDQDEVPHEDIEGSSSAVHEDNNNNSAAESEGLTDFSEEHMKEVSGCWKIFFNLCEHGPMRRTEKAKLQALRDAGQTKAFLAAAKANERNNRIGNAVRELLKSAKEQGNVTALDQCKKMLKTAEEEVKRVCMETKESFIPASAARTGSDFSLKNGKMDVRSLFQ